MNRLPELLQAERDTYKSLGVPLWLTHEFLLRDGGEFTDQRLPKRYRQRPSTNAITTHGSLYADPVHCYCEGTCISRDLPLPISHAWAIDRTV
jgi:hypothetical protein